jgi:hypothetical protein
MPVNKLPEAFIEAYITRRLREEAEKGTLLSPELVDGKTVAEVEESIRVAIRIYRRRQVYFDAFHEPPAPDAAPAPKAEGVTVFN